jgi:FMN phosphatase YigB (HAD superfamily)
MLLALLLDLGETLVHQDKVIEHVPEALDLIRSLRTFQGIPLPLALVSNYTMPAPGAPQTEVAQLFDEYVDYVRRVGLLRYFEPAELHITLSTQAGVKKPDPAIFRVALQRLGLAPDLSTGMFITEEPQHIAAARALGMTAWQYGRDFRDWRQAVSIVADALVQDIAALEKAGGVSAESRFKKALEDNAAIAQRGRALAPGETHVEEIGPDGRPRLTRKRFSLK